VLGEEMLLKGKNAIITGSNRGLGKEIAREFIREGANVVICARDYDLLYITKEELSVDLKEGQKLYVFSVDISNKFHVESFFRSVMCVFDRIDILVNNAGIQGTKGLVDIKDYESWVKTININLIGTVHMCMIFLPEFKKQGFGKILNLSGGGSANPRPHFSAYATSKAAVVRFSETLAEELRGTGIDVNCIAPGALNTRLLDEVLEAGEEKIGKEYYQRALKQKESGGSSIINSAEMITFLASENCDGITGKLISAVWDDWKDLPNHKQELNNTDIYTLRRILPSDVNPYWFEEK
jgi:NAD(P)-dependent dehydrogenase (short-subunit alcohol dehydrogenase family)